MLIKDCQGYELEKEKPNTSEDFFNRSEVTFEEDGQTRTLQILYVRYFEEKLAEFTPFETNPIFTAQGEQVQLKDIVALVCLIKDPALKHRKKVYINNQAQFAAYFEKLNWSKVEEVITSLKRNKAMELPSLLMFSL